MSRDLATQQRRIVAEVIRGDVQTDSRQRALTATCTKLAIEAGLGRRAPLVALHAAELAAVYLRVLQPTGQ